MPGRVGKDPVDAWNDRSLLIPTQSPVQSGGGGVDLSGLTVYTGKDGLDRLVALMKWSTPTTTQSAPSVIKSETEQMLRIAVENTVRILKSNDPAIVDTVWVDEVTTLLDLCELALSPDDHLSGRFESAPSVGSVPTVEEKP